MISLPTSPAAHYLGDASAWIAAAVSARWQHKRWPNESLRLSGIVQPSYFVWLAAGAVIGAWIFGSGNSMYGPLRAPSHSIAGALAGGIVAVELWKARHRIRASTGGSFVLPICIGISVGRLGCLFSGLPDYTYGTPTTLPWAVDLGDGIGRHPVQFYESLSMAVFVAAYLHARFAGADWARHRGFQAMIIVYACQRFLWEFLKPYPAVLGPLNVFHLLMLGLLVYGITWWHRDGASELGTA